MTLKTDLANFFPDEGAGSAVEEEDATLEDAFVGVLFDTARFRFFLEAITGVASGDGGVEVI